MKIAISIVSFVLLLCIVSTCSTRLKCENNSKEKCTYTVCNSAVDSDNAADHESKKKWMLLVVKLIEL